MKKIFIIMLTGTNISGIGHGGGAPQRTNQQQQPQQQSYVSYAHNNASGWTSSGFNSQQQPVAVAYTPSPYGSSYPAQQYPSPFATSQAGASPLAAAYTPYSQNQSPYGATGQSGYIQMNGMSSTQTAQMQAMQKMQQYVASTYQNVLGSFSQLPLTAASNIPNMFTAQSTITQYLTEDLAADLYSNNSSIATGIPLPDFLYVAILYTVFGDGQSNVPQGNSDTPKTWLESDMTKTLFNILSPSSKDSYQGTTLYGLCSEYNIPLVLLDGTLQYGTSDNVNESGEEVNVARNFLTGVVNVGGPWTGLSLINGTTQYLQSTIDAMAGQSDSNLAYNSFHSSWSNNSSLYNNLSQKGVLDDGRDHPFSAWNCNHPGIIFMQLINNNGTYTINPAIYYFSVKPGFLNAMGTSESSKQIDPNFENSFAQFVIQNMAPALQYAGKGKAQGEKAWAVTTTYPVTPPTTAN